MTPVLMAAESAMDVSLWIFVTAACLFSCCLGSACTYYAVNWSRDRQEEADQQRRENAIEHGLKLAQDVQQLEQRISGDTPAVDDAELPDYVAPKCRGCSGTPTVLREDGVWLCADCDDHTRRFLARQARRAEDVDLSGVSVIPLVDIPPPDPAHPCEWFIGDTDDECGEPADNFVTDSDGDPVWLCPTHVAWVPEPAGPDYSGWSRAVASPVDDDPADTLPHVTPRLD